MSLNEDIQKYIDPETGMIAGRDMGRDNLVLNTATLIMLLGNNNSHADAWSEKLVQFLYDCQSSYGCFYRYPGSTDSNSVDNLTAVCTVYSNITKRVWARGEVSNWYFPVGTGGFNLKHWYGRFLGFPDFVRMRANKRISKIGVLKLRLAFWFVVRSPYGNTSDKCLAVLMLRYMPGMPWVIRMGELFSARMWMKYPGGLKELYGIYFGPDHPFTKYAPKEFC